MGRLSERWTQMLLVEYGAKMEKDTMGGVEYSARRCYKKGKKVEWTDIQMEVIEAGGQEVTRVMPRPGRGLYLGLGPILGREGEEFHLQDQGRYRRYQGRFQGLYQDLYQDPGQGQGPGGLVGQNGENHMIVGVEAAAEAEAEALLGLGVVRGRELGRDLRLPGGHPFNKGPIINNDLQATNNKHLHLHLHP